MNYTSHSNCPLIWGWSSLKLDNTIKIFGQSTIDESFVSKVKRSLSQVQMWAPSLVAYMESFKSSTRGETSWEKNLKLVLLCGNQVYWVHRGQNHCQPVSSPRMVSNMPCVIHLKTMSCPYMASYMIAIYGHAHVRF